MAGAPCTPPTGALSRSQFSTRSTSDPRTSILQFSCSIAESDKGAVRSHEFSEVEQEAALHCFEVLQVPRSIPSAALSASLCRPSSRRLAAAARLTCGKMAHKPKPRIWLEIDLRYLPSKWKSIRCPSHMLVPLPGNAGKFVPPQVSWFLGRR